jgi:hypothetical protein
VHLLAYSCVQHTLPISSSLDFYHHNNILHKAFREPGSSVSIVSGYGLDDRTNEVRSPSEAKDFSSKLCVQTGYGAHSASYIIGTGGPFPGEKCDRSVTLTTHPHLVSRSRKNRSYTSFPPKGIRGTALALENISLTYTESTVFLSSWI